MGNDSYYHKTGMILAGNKRKPEGRVNTTLTFLLMSLAKVFEVVEAGKDILFGEDQSRKYNL